MNPKKIEDTLTLRIVNGEQPLGQDHPVAWPNITVGCGYRVTQSSHDGTLEIGDYIRCEENGSIYCRAKYRCIGGYIAPAYLRCSFLGIKLVLDCSIRERLRKWFTL